MKPNRSQLFITYTGSILLVLYDSARKPASRLKYNLALGLLREGIRQVSLNFAWSRMCIGQHTSGEKGPMRCAECDGLMVADDLVDLRESYHPMWMRAWRCVACGNVIDPLILRNRMIQEAGALHLLNPWTPPLIQLRSSASA